MGGKKVKEPSLFLLGQIRACRSKQVKDELISDLKHVLIKNSKLDETQVWVYINDLPPSQMIEYGAVLPDSGKEKEWFANLPVKLKKKLAAIEKQFKELTIHFCLFLNQTQLFDVLQQQDIAILQILFCI